MKLIHALLLLAAVAGGSVLGVLGRSATFSTDFALGALFGALAVAIVAFVFWLWTASRPADWQGDV